MLRSTAATGILTIGEAGTINALTPEAQRLLQLPAGQTPVLHDLPAPLQSIVREVQLTGQTVAHRQIALPPGNSVPALVTVTATPSALGGPASIVVLLNGDCSAAKLEHNLRRLDRLASIGTVSAIMAHEIKNALVAVRTFLDLLLEKNPDAELAGVVRREISRVDSIVTDMLKFSAPAPPAFAPIRVHELLEHSLRLVQHGAKNKSISFQRHFAAASDAFHGDDHQLEQAFVNLLFNAVEAMPAEGSLTVSTDLIANKSQSERQAEPQQLLRIRITDTGVGIMAEKLNYIFEPFFTTKPSGTGLGLSVTQRIITEHHGTIHVESLPDHGTSFIVLLPAGTRAH